MHTVRLERIDEPDPWASVGPGVSLSTILAAISAPPALGVAVTDEASVLPVEITSGPSGPGIVELVALIVPVGAKDLFQT